MLTLRLARVGTKKRPVYHLVATDSRNARDGRFNEKLGHYVPGREVLVFKQERIQYWLGHGARTTNAAARLIRRNRKFGNQPLGEPKAPAPTPEKPVVAKKSKSPAPAKDVEAKVPPAAEPAAPSEKKSE